MCLAASSFFFFFNDTATTEIYTLSLHDALPILLRIHTAVQNDPAVGAAQFADRGQNAFTGEDRKSTRLNSSHSQISYAVFCLKKKKKQYTSRLCTTLNSPPVLRPPRHSTTVCVT